MVTDIERAQRRLSRAHFIRGAVALGTPLLPAFAAVSGAISGTIPMFLVLLCATAAVVFVIAGLVNFRYATEDHKAMLAIVRADGPWPTNQRDYDQHRKAIIRNGYNEKILVAMGAVIVLFIAGVFLRGQWAFILLALLVVVFVSLVFVIASHRMTNRLLADLAANYSPAPAGE